MHNLKADLFERDYAFASERPGDAAAGSAPDISWLSAPGWAGRHAELHRRGQHGQLFGQHVALCRRQSSATGPGGGISPISTACSPSPTRGAAGCRLKGSTIRSSSACSPGFAHHPNVAAYVIVGLGCEVSYASHLVETQHLVTLGAANGNGQKQPAHRPRTLNIQEEGGITRTVEAAARAVYELMPEANSWVRTEQPASKICLAMECGGSDGNSGVTANPALGEARRPADRAGGTAILGETTEIYGAEHLLTRASRLARGGPEAGRSDQVVGVVHRRLRRQDRQ